MLLLSSTCAAFRAHTKLPGISLLHPLQRSCKIIFLTCQNLQPALHFSKRDQLIGVPEIAIKNRKIPPGVVNNHLPGYRRITRLLFTQQERFFRLLYRFFNTRQVKERFSNGSLSRNASAAVLSYMAMIISPPSTVSFSFSPLYTGMGISYHHIACPD